ncbi:MAG: S1 RNA-binding domain-containing protein [bacterium]|nr:S1 RNA-binding domain-containing protein [bacterium]
MTNQIQNQTGSEELRKLLLTKDFTKIPKEGETVKGIVIAASKNEVRVDIEGFKTGVIRGPELSDVKMLYPDLKEGQEIEATVIDLDNEDGEVELSLRFTGQRRVWDEIEKMKQENQTVEAKIVDANRGGLMAVVGSQNVGFIPVSQLSPEHYPRVPGGDKSKILEKLREFIGQSIKVKVLDFSEKEKKIIFSEKSIWEEDQKEMLSKYKVGDVIEGKVTALADFGAFVAFDELEGLVHISEIAWQRLDNPADVLKVGDEVKAKIIGLEGSKIFLSIRELVDDPWKKAEERYKVGQIVKGKVLKVNPFGLFVELDPEIHGLAHVSELELGPGEKPEEKIKPNDEVEFRIVSLESAAHRLGLSQKALKEKPAETIADKKEEVKEEPAKPESDVKEKTEVKEEKREAEKVEPPKSDPETKDKTEEVKEQ